MPSQATYPSSIPDCKEEGCDRKVVTISTKTDFEYYAKEEYRQVAALGIPLEAHQRETLILGYEVAEICSLGHEMSYYRYKDGEESEAVLTNAPVFEFRRETA